MDTGEVTVGASQPAAPSGPWADISVVTPSRNQGRYLDETIASVLGQEGNFALDYLVIDGASTDSSVDVLRRYETRLRQGDWPLRCRRIRFRWLSEPDRGQSDALAKGLRLATGGVLGWLNSDDTYLPSALATIGETFAQDSACAVVYGKAHYVDEAGVLLGDYPTEPFSSERLAVANFLAQPSTFFRQRTLEQSGGPDVDLHYVMDYDLWLRMAQSGHFRYVETFLSNYRLHKESKTVAARHALENARECLDIVHKHRGWAPANRVYEFCSQWIQASIPSPKLTKQPVVALLATPLALAKYVAMNRGVRRADLKLLTRKNARRLFERQRLY
jgi:glycosyltransferase involved in cell wall biosynthesis